jgi:hypothetical protein
VTLWVRIYVEISVETSARMIDVEILITTLLPTYKTKILDVQNFCITIECTSYCFSILYIP